MEISNNPDHVPMGSTEAWHCLHEKLKSEVTDLFWWIKTRPLHAKSYILPWLQVSLKVRRSRVSTYLVDPVALETEEQTLKREQTERDVLEALGEYKCDSTMSV